MKKSYLKRTISVMLSAAMILTAVIPARAEEGNTGTAGETEVQQYIWTLGYGEDNVNGPEDGNQGANGWYFMYTNQIDVGESDIYNADQFKNCVWSGNNGSLQLQSEGGTYEKMWMPKEYLEESLTGEALNKPDSSNPDGTFNNWVMTSDGTLNPDVETTAVTGIYAWKAPADGTYNFDMNYEAGGDHCDLGGTRYYYVNDYYIKDGTDDKRTPDQREGGVAISVVANASKQAYVTCIAKTSDHDFLYNGTFTGKVTLSEGEMIYFVVDPREVGSYDRANLQITVTNGTCEWSGPEYVWDGYGKCTATRTCSNANHKNHTRTVTVEGEVTELIKEATCTEDGEAIFKAVFDDESLVEQTARQTIQALGHDTSNAFNDAWSGNAKFVWSDDFSICTWTTPCARCRDYVEVEDDSVKIYRESDEGEGSATCTKPGRCTYQASFYWGWVWSDKVEDITNEPLGHDYSKAEYVWADDNSTCTKTLYCKRCGEESPAEPQNGIIEEEPATCTEDGVYTAIFDGGYDWTQKPSGKKALGHLEPTEGVTYTWSDDNSTCTKSYTCAREGCGEEIELTADAVITEPTCTEDGQAVATFEGETEPQVEVIPMLGHDYEVKYEWSADKTTCTKSYVCTRCNAKDETRTVTVNTTKTEPTCTAAGKYTASFDNGKDIQTSAIPALGHSWSTWTTSSAATTSSPEIQKRTCSRCGAEESQTVGSALKQITTVKKVTGISISGISKKIAAGKKIQLTATVKPAKAANKAVTWKSSNKKYATVTSKGKVTTKAAGKGHTVTITATAKDGSGVKATYKIKIMKSAVKSISLKQSAKSVKAGKKVTVKATVKTTGKSTANKTLKWTSSNTKYATVTSKGKVTTKKAGKGHTVKITAAATDGSGKKKTVKIKIK